MRQGVDELTVFRLQDADGRALNVVVTHQGECSELFTLHQVEAHGAGVTVNDPEDPAALLRVWLDELDRRGA